MGGRHEPGTVYFIKGDNKDGDHPWTCLFHWQDQLGLQHGTKVAFVDAILCIIA